MTRFNWTHFNSL